MRKAISLLLGLLIICAIAGLVYIAVAPKVGEKLTEFYILGPEGKAEGYPTEVRLGNEAKVIAGIVNHEYEEISYRLVVMIGGVRNNEVGPIVLAHGDEWQEEVSFSPKEPGENQKIEFLLYEDGETEPRLTPLYLWVDVR